MPLKATVTASVFEPGGRPVRESVFLKVRPKPLYLGVRIDQQDSRRRLISSPCSNWAIAVIVRLVPATENMPGGRAVKPGDVVTSLASSDRLINATNDITVADALVWNTGQTLALDAGHDVVVNAAMTASTAGSASGSLLATGSISVLAVTLKLSPCTVNVTRISTDPSLSALAFPAGGSIDPAFTPAGTA